MLVKFKGERKRESRSYGCSKCGTGRSINGVETYSTVYRTYYEGRLYVFMKDKVYPVDDILGGYLINLKYTDNEGNIQNTFEEVPDNTTSTYVQDNKEKEFELETKEETPKVEETPKEVEPPKVEEAPKPVEPKVEEKPKVEEPTVNNAVVNEGVPEAEL
jgi:hypothetical protein